MVQMTNSTVSLFTNISEQLQQRITLSRSRHFLEHSKSDFRSINMAKQTYRIIIQLSPEGEVNSGGYIPRREASRYISTALHRP